MLEADRFLAEDVDQRGSHELDHLLSRGEALVDLGPLRPLLHVFHERLDDLQRHIRLEQRKADLAQNLVNLFLVESPTAAQAREDVIEAAGQGVEHRSRLSRGERHGFCGHPKATPTRAKTIPATMRTYWNDRARPGSEMK